MSSRRREIIPDKNNPQDQQLSLEEQHQLQLQKQQEQPSQKHVSSIVKVACPNCGGSDIEVHQSSGASICTSCGVVVEENAIVSNVDFAEGARGSSAMVGKYVGPNATKAYSGMGRGGGGGGVGGGGYGFSRDSREATLANARRKIQDVAGRLRLGNHYIDSAHRLYAIAVERNFVQGRKSMHVIAACLYMTCRQEKSQHMLIDFSDALQVNVYSLGTCFLKFRRLLGLKLEIIDPALYVYRFAAHLNLDDRANAVALTAIRLVGRMRRDWIVAGRRPAGVCAAALLIAARAHGFEREECDVTKVLRVCGMTVSNRIRDFEATPSSNLTLEQFGTVDVVSEADPPVFTRNRLREARVRAIRSDDTGLLESGKLDDPRQAEKKRGKWREASKPSSSDTNWKATDRAVEMKDLYQDLKSELEEKMMVVTGTTEEGAEDTTTIDAKIEKDTGEKGSKRIEITKDINDDTGGSNNRQLILASKSIRCPKGNGGRVLVLPEQATVEELRAPTVPPEGLLDMEKWKSCLPPPGSEGSVDDFFLKDLLRSDEEVKHKEVVFDRVNSEYLITRERKEQERISVEKKEKDLQKDVEKQEEERSRYLTLRRGRKRIKGSAITTSSSKIEDVDLYHDENAEFPMKNEMVPTTEEALLAAVSSRKISRKINYEALGMIFDDEGTFSTDLLEDRGKVVKKDEGAVKKDEGGGKDPPFGSVSGSHDGGSLAKTEDTGIDEFNNSHDGMTYEMI